MQHQAQGKKQIFVKSKAAAGCLGDFRVTRLSLNKQSIHTGTPVAIHILEIERPEREKQR